MKKKNLERPIYDNGGITYETYNDGKVTKATLSGVAWNFDNAMRRIFKDSKCLRFNHVFDKKKLTYTYQLPNTFTAKAKLNPVDEQNPEVGENVAHDRVMDKYHRAFDANMREVVEDIHRTVARLYRYCEKKNINIKSCKSIEDFLKD